MTRFLDRLFVLVIVVLTVATPLALGSVLPGIYSIAEVAMFSLVLIAILKVWIAHVDVIKLCDRATVWLATGLALFAGLALVQLMPLPPSLERIISPGTYDFYVKSLPGWPARLPFSDVISETKPTAGPWMPLSIAPSLTANVLLKLGAYIGLFFSIILYPFGEKEDQKHAELLFYRTTIIALMVAALLTAVVGLIEAATWNGRILWIFSPYGWDGQLPSNLTRLSGPFVNPDRFANYLALVLPIALSGLAFRTFSASAGYEGAFRIFCGVTTAVLLGGIFGSLSRAGWISVLLSITILIWLAGGRSEGSKLNGTPLWKRHPLGVYGVSIFVLVVLAWVLVGPWERKQADLRLSETMFGEVSLPTRVAYWHDSLAMIRDFPLFGVGLGCWPESFPHYRRPPWTDEFSPAAHNDYVQLVTEAGVPGFLLFMGLCIGAGLKLYRARSQLSPLVLPVFAALLAGLATMAFHELFDFNLQIPANAILFTVLMALAFRLAGGRSEVWASLTDWTPAAAAISLAGAVTGVALILLSLRQGGAPYPYSLTWADSAPAARALLIAHPANSQVHLWLANDLAYRLTNLRRLQELRSAIWVEPTKPFARDRYAQVLLKQHRDGAGLFHIEQSVFFSPAPEYHSYLAPEQVASLSHEESTAVEKGLTRAVAENFAGAADSLGSFYDHRGDFGAEARLFEKVASANASQDQAYQYLIAAASAYARAHDSTKAERLLRRAIALEPGEVQAYAILSSLMFASSHNPVPSKVLLKEAINNGVDPYPIYLGLSQQATAAAQWSVAEWALLKAVELHPGAPQTAEQLGLVFLNENKLDRAIAYFHRSLEIQSRSHQVIYFLAVAEERNYQYFAAQRDYARASDLDPRNPTYTSSLQALKRKVADNMVPAKLE